MEGQVQEPLPQVFVNFRGVELRDNFVSHLELELKNSGINVFIDSNERKGRRLQHLFTRIKKSKIALAIFSERYCESKWCLDELVTMNEQMKEKKLVVIPIFFNVSADDVKRAANPNRNAYSDRESVPDGEFTLLFKQMKQKYADEPEKVKKWECALRSVTKRMGFSRSNYRDEFTFIYEIVKEVRRQLDMPIKKSWSDAEVAILTFLLNLLFTFVIAPFGFRDLKFLRTREWFICSLVLALALRICYKKYQNKAPPPS